MSIIAVKENYLVLPPLELPPPPPELLDDPPPLDMELPEEPLEGVYEGVLLVVGLDGCVVVGLDGCVVAGRVVVLERGVLLVPVVGRVVVLVRLPTASLLVVAPRVVRVPTREELEDPLVTLPFSVRTRLVFPTAERVVVRVPFAVARVVRPVTIRPFLSRATRELETRVVFPTRVLYPPRAATRVGALAGRTLYRFPP